MKAYCLGPTGGRVKDGHCENSTNHGKGQLGKQLDFYGVTLGPA